MIFTKTSLGLKPDQTMPRLTKTSISLGTRL